MQNQILKFRQSSILSMKPGYLTENWKLCRAPTNVEYNVFRWNLAHVSYLIMSTKGRSIIFIFFRSWVIDKNVKTRSLWICTNQLFLILENNSRSRQKKKYLEHSFVDK